MNIIFWMLVIIALVGVWFCCAAIFIPIGAIILRIFADTKDIITNNETKGELE